VGKTGTAPGKRADATVETPPRIPPYGSTRHRRRQLQTGLRNGACPMSTSSSSNFETAIKWIVVVILAIAALKIIATVLGIAFVLGSFLLWRVLPLVLVVWLIFKAIEWMRDSKGSSTSTTDF
jgi:hypothetical protein